MKKIILILFMLASANAYARDHDDYDREDTRPITTSEHPKPFDPSEATRKSKEAADRSRDQKRLEDARARNTTRLPHTYERRDQW